MIVMARPSGMHTSLERPRRIFLAATPSIGRHLAHSNFLYPLRVSDRVSDCTYVSWAAPRCGGLCRVSNRQKTVRWGTDFAAPHVRARCTMISQFDIFRVEDSQISWQEAATSLHEAKARVSDLGATCPGEYLIFNQQTGTRVSINVESKSGLNS
jgi:hypothetical protein